VATARELASGLLLSVGLLVGVPALGGLTGGFVALMVGAGLCRLAWGGPV